MDYHALLNQLVFSNPPGAVEFAKALATAEGGSLIDLQAATDTFVASNRLQEAAAFLFEALKGDKPEHADLQTRLIEINLTGGAPQVADAILQVNTIIFEPSFDLSFASFLYIFLLVFIILFSSPLPLLSSPLLFSLFFLCPISFLLFLLPLFLFLQNRMFSHFDRAHVAKLCERAGLHQRAAENYTEISDIKRVFKNSHQMNPDFVVSFFSTLTQDDAIALLKDMLSRSASNMQVVVEVAKK